MYLLGIQGLHPAASPACVTRNYHDSELGTLTVFLEDGKIRVAKCKESNDTIIVQLEKRRPQFI